jgi:hypothetical protein
VVLGAVAEVDVEELIAELRAQLADEKARREAAEKELENLQKGSIAMMKYTANLQRQKNDEELRLKEARISDLEEQVEALKRGQGAGTKRARFVRK